MTIAKAFNDIAQTLGGSVKGRTITEAIDALNDVLASSDQEAANTIEGAIRLLGENIGISGSATWGPVVHISFYNSVSEDFQIPKFKVYATEPSSENDPYISMEGSIDTVELAVPGGLFVDAGNSCDEAWINIDGEPEEFTDFTYYNGHTTFTVPVFVEEDGDVNLSFVSNASPK